MEINHNSDIILRELSQSDFRDGMYIQSFGNIDTIYQLSFIDGEWVYAATHKIENRRTEGDKIMGDPYIKEFSNDRTSAYWNARQKASTGHWCQTTFTQELVALERSEKIDSILSSSSLLESLPDSQ